MFKTKKTIGGKYNMQKLSFTPDFDNPNTVMGAIYMTNHHNVYEVVSVVDRFLKKEKNTAVYNYFVDVFAYQFKASPLKFMSAVINAITKENERLIIDVVNNQTVIRAIKSAYLNSNHFDKDAVAHIAKSFESIITKDNVLQILRGKVSHPIFMAFGYHPAISEDIELQKRWIFTIAAEPLYAIRCIPWHVTDEGLEAAANLSLDKAVKFINEFFNGVFHNEEMFARFTTQTLRKIVSLYAVAESPSYAEKVMNKIKMSESRGLFKHYKK